MVALRKHIPEAIVIVVSILLAFAIDAGWESSQRNSDERELLSFIIEEIDLTIEQLTERLLQTGIDQSNFLEFYAKKESELATVNWNDATRYFNSLYRPNTVEITQSSYLGIVSSGSINLIKNVSVRNALENLSFEAGSLARRSTVMTTVENASLTAVSNHEVFQIWNLNNVEDLPYDVSVQPPEPSSDFLDLSLVRADPNVIGSANALFLQRRINSRFLANLRETLQEVLRIINEPSG